MSNKFNVHITAGKEQSSCFVGASGIDKHVITDAERETFQLGTDAQLKKAVENYKGAYPDDAYLHSPTPWGDLYEKFDWEQTKVTLEPTASQILSVSTQPVQVRQQTFVNDSSVTGIFDCSISQEVTTTSASSWSTGGTFEASQSIDYHVGFLGTGGGGESSMSYSQEWGKGGETSSSITIGSESGVTVELKPDQAVVATLYASKGVMKVRVKYAGYLLDGRCAVNYANTFEGHHFYGLHILNILTSNSMEFAYECDEDITIDYYSDGVVRLSDPETNKVISSHRVGDSYGDAKKFPKPAIKK